MKAFRAWFISRFTPLQQLLIIGGLLRLVSVIFSKGFAWSDDHFLIIESASSWADGYYNFWLPTKEFPDREPQGHALFYIGLHYYYFVIVKWLGMSDPQMMMLPVRFLHAAWSLLIITYGYRLAHRYAGEKAAWYTGLFLACYWFMPFVSVRNLVEYVCVPPCLIAIYRLGKEEIKIRDYLVAGIWLGVAFSIRFQAVLIVAGLGLALLLQRRPLLHIIYLGLAFSGIVFITQGLVDLIIWKKPFTEFMAYVQYNLDNATAYGTDNWHMYLDLIFGMLIPPLSLVLVAGYFYSWKKTALIFWPVLLYLAFHFYFPNKQERFVMTILPLIIISGVVGMTELYTRFGHYFNKRLLRWTKYFVVVVNLPALALFTTSYTKRFKVEAMTYLCEKGDAGQVWFEDSNREDGYQIPPLYYLGHWQFNIGITKNFTADSALAEYKRLPLNQRPNYMVFWQGENINARVDSVKKRFPGLVFETAIEASPMDQLLHFFNPLIDNETSYIYKIDNAVMEEKLNGNTNKAP